MDETDEQLMLDYVDGNITSFEALYHRHRAPLFRYILRQVASHHTTAEEIFQEVWSSVVSARKQYKPVAKFSTWLYTLAHHRTVDHFRRKAVRLVEPDTDEVDNLLDHTTDPAKQLAIDHCVELLLSLIQALPNDQRNVFILRQESHHSLDEIAKITSSTHESTKSRLRYAVKKLRTPLEEEDCL